VFSPNGNYIAFTFDESAQEEVYVVTYPGLSSKWQISTNGGSEPVWSRGGGELFYRLGNAMMAVPVDIYGADLAPGAPTQLFDGDYRVV
jgi:serine/threonine-protein kinase